MSWVDIDDLSRATTCLLKEGLVSGSEVMAAQKFIYELRQLLPAGSDVDFNDFSMFMDDVEV